MKTTIAVFLMCCLVSGCAHRTMPGRISESVSKVDGAKEIRMEPVRLYNSPLKLGLSTGTSRNSDAAILKVAVRGVHNFADGSSLLIKIDGEKIALESIDALTDIDLEPGQDDSGVKFNWSSKRYEIRKEIIKRMLEGKNVWIQVRLYKASVEGLFSKEALITAKPSFRNFYQKVWGQ